MKTALAPIAAVLCALMLSGCGADGLPTPPSKAASDPGGLQVSGEARLGVVKTW
jgi:hypothetical protein